MDDDESKKAGGDTMPEGGQPSCVCANCGMQNRPEAKFCDQCSQSMAAPPLEDPDDKDPPSSKKPGAVVAIPEPKRISAEASVASILGASSESIPAVKGRAIDLRQVFDTAAGVTGKSDPREIVGALLTMPERIARGDQAAADLKTRERQTEASTRWDLAKRLNALNLDGRPRSTIFEDKIDDKTGQRSIALRPEYARMDLGVFRGLVEGFESSHAKKKSDPFKPSEERARAAAASADPRQPPAADAPAAAVVSWAQSQPAFPSMRRQLPSTITDEAIGRQLAATMRGGVR